MNVEDKIKAIEEAEKKATEAPWEWQDGFTSIDDKYADCRLLAGEVEIIPIRVDHHESIWDIDPDDIGSDAIRPLDGDRNLIAILRNNARAMLRLLRAYRAEIDTHRRFRVEQAVIRGFTSVPLADIDRQCWEATDAAEATFVGEA